MERFYLQMPLQLQAYKPGIMCFVTAFVCAMLVMPPLISLIKRYNFFDVPDLRKAHAAPVPTMGGIAAYAGMMLSLLAWYHFSADALTLSFFCCLLALFALGVLDDLYDVRAWYKLVVQVAAAFVVAWAGARITSLEGLFGIYGLPVTLQYAVTLVAIVGITNAFNLIDGVDGLAGGLGFMSLVSLGLFLTLSGQTNMGLIAFALAGGLLGFLYYNFNPARIFMGDTGSLVLGFTVAVLSVMLLRINSDMPAPVIGNAPIVALSVVLIPVFDTLRVFSVRVGKGRSPFHPDKSHIHHLLTNNGWSHAFTSKLIWGLHACILWLGFLSHSLPPELALFLLFAAMTVVVFLFKKMRFADEEAGPEMHLP